MAFIGSGLGNDGTTDTGDNAVTITFPGGTLAGHVGVLWSSQNTGTKTHSAPAGWTLRHGPDDLLSTLRRFVWTKTLTAGDITTGSVTVTTSGSGRLLARLEVWSNVTEAGVLVSETGDGSADTTATSPALTLPNTNYSVMNLWALRRAAATASSITSFPAGHTQMGSACQTNVPDPNYTLQASRFTPGSTSVGGQNATINASSMDAVYTVALKNVSAGGATVSLPTATATAMVDPPTVYSGTPTPLVDTRDPDEVYREGIRSGGIGIAYTVDATLGGVPVDGAQGLTPIGGRISDTTRPGVRRTLAASFAPQVGLYELLKPEGVQLTVNARITYVDRTTRHIPMGVFDIDSETVEDGTGGVSLTAPDKWVQIQRARFIRPQKSVKGRLIVLEIAALIRGALGADETVNILATSTETVAALTFEKDRDKAIIDLATSIGAWVYFDREGRATIEDIPTLGVSADWLIDHSPNGVLIDLTRERSRTGTHNVVVVESSSAEDAKFTTQVVWDSDPSSPTYAGTDPVNNPGSAGPFGIVTFFHDNPSLSSDNAARAAGRTILARVRGLAAQVSLTTVPNPLLDAFDVLDVLPPPERRDQPRAIERHVADTVTHPLDDGSPQTIEGRSTRTDDFTGG